MEEHQRREEKRERETGECWLRAVVKVEREGE
jgi:hypothetical protein